MADISLNIACKELKIAQIAQLNQLFQLLHLVHIQLFQLTLSVQSKKLKDKTESLRGIFMNKFIKISHAWRKQ